MQPLSSQVDVGAHLPNALPTSEAMKGAPEGRNVPWPSQGGEPDKSHLVAILFPEIKDGPSPFSGGICCVKNLGPNWG